MSGHRVAVLTASWTRAPGSEMATAMRSLAGACSRLAAVDVYVPGGAPVADGAFDLRPLGARAPHAGGGGAKPGRWPDPADASAPTAPEPAGYRAVLVEEGDPGARPLAAVVAPGAAVLTVCRSAGSGAPALAVGFTPDTAAETSLPTTAPVDRTGLYCRVHPGARERRHYGLRGVPDYLLILGDRRGMPVPAWPSDAVRWVLARFARSYVVVVEGGAARAWRSRSCVAEFEVHTRMDLWMLMARATAVVDLLPGEVFARECVESLRYGVPIAVPAGSAAAGLARGGGGLAFSSTAELLSCAGALADPATREALATAGRALADRWYGDPAGLVVRLGAALDAATPRSRPA
ncbi:MAG TPA: hypothetical protein VND62_06405 [Acidimicrobiales bacterium]|nr:hypothetical protein [Acidimicrobiales bacterium]